MDCCTGPSILESRQTVSSHLRSNLTSLVKTPPEVWKRGKAPTEPISGPLPGLVHTHLETKWPILPSLVRQSMCVTLGSAPYAGSNSANRAKLHTPSHLRGVQRVTFQTDDTEEELPKIRSHSAAHPDGGTAHRDLRSHRKGNHSAGELKDMASSRSRSATSTVESSPPQISKESSLEQVERKVWHQQR